MKLLRYKVTQFRSVDDSGWIECDNVTTLVGVNESGKTNLLLALWKLNPAREGKIDVLHDMPVSKLSSLRNKTGEVVFVTAEFLIEASSAKRLRKATGYAFSETTVVQVSRRYNGECSISFPNGEPDSISRDPYDEDEDYKSKTPISANETCIKEIIDEIPKFVYYSNYGNLSSKIYLPHAIKWLNGQTVTGIETNEEQVRTLRVLFEFVNLNPKEIYQLGMDPKGPNGNLTKEQIQKAASDKEERSILLQSASVDLTRRFKDWWKQGEYKIRFEADGDYFRIWVSDSVRTDEVGLELRSTGLQWFLSFYLVFLVESQEAHKNAILLLDEAGLTLHPLAQRDLAQFFDNLSEKNQIINTTHSPFIIDTTNIDRCRVVFSDENGFTVASSDLRQGAGELGNRSIYAVHAALGLTVSDVLLQGCQCIIVEGPSDQHYFNGIKTYLIGKGKISPNQEIVFVPSGGVRGVSGVVSLISGKGNDLPYTILDSDKSGQEAKRKLTAGAGLYACNKDKLLEVETYTLMENSEVEDLIPFILMERGINRLFNSLEDEEFADVYDKSRPIIPQIESFATKNDVDLPKGWKVELAKSVKQALKSKKADNLQEEDVLKWEKLFSSFLS